MTSPDTNGPAALRGGFAASEPLGVNEIAELLEAKVGTVRMWRARRIFPEPRWVLSGTPVWERATVEAWARATGRWPGDAPRHALVEVEPPPRAPAKLPPGEPELIVPGTLRAVLAGGAEAEFTVELSEAPSAPDTPAVPSTPVPAAPVRAEACPRSCPVRMYGAGAQHRH